MVKENIRGMEDIYQVVFFGAKNYSFDNIIKRRINGGLYAV